MQIAERRGLITLVVLGAILEKCAAVITIIQLA
jgi:hypothetical protein